MSTINNARATHVLSSFGESRVRPMLAAKQDVINLDIKKGTTSEDYS